MRDGKRLRARTWYLSVPRRGCDGIPVTAITLPGQALQAVLAIPSASPALTGDRGTGARASTSAHGARYWIATATSEAPRNPCQRWFK